MVGVRGYWFNGVLIEPGNGNCGSGDDCTCSRATARYEPRDRGAHPTRKQTVPKTENVKRMKDERVTSRNLTTTAYLIAED